MKGAQEQQIFFLIYRSLTTTDFKFIILQLLSNNGKKQHSPKELEFSNSDTNLVPCLEHHVFFLQSERALAHFYTLWTLCASLLFTQKYGSIRSNRSCSVEFNMFLFYFFNILHFCPKIKGIVTKPVFTLCVHSLSSSDVLFFGFHICKVLTVFLTESFCIVPLKMFNLNYF